MLIAYQRGRIPMAHGVKDGLMAATGLSAEQARARVAWQQGCACLRQLPQEHHCLRCDQYAAKVNLYLYLDRPLSWQACS